MGCRQSAEETQSPHKFTIELMFQKAAAHNVSCDWLFSPLHSGAAARTPAIVVPPPLQTLSSLTPPFMVLLARFLNVVLQVIEIEVGVAVLQLLLAPQLLQLWKSHMP